MRTHVLLVALGLLVLSFAPAAAAASEDDGVPACTDPLGMGVVEYAVCWAKVTSCIAWRVVWGEDEPCPA